MIKTCIVLHDLIGKHGTLALEADIQIIGNTNEVRYVIEHSQFPLAI